jgi:hypothetical protein
VRFGSATLWLRDVRDARGDGLGERLSRFQRRDAIPAMATPRATPSRPSISRSAPATAQPCSARRAAGLDATADQSQ